MLCAPFTGAKQPLDTGLESAKVCSKKADPCMPAVGCISSGETLGKVGLGGEGRGTDQVSGTFWEVADRRTVLMQEMLQRGLKVHKVPGEVDVRRVELFDDSGVEAGRGGLVERGSLRQLGRP